MEKYEVILDIYDKKWRIPAVKEKKSSCCIEEIQHVPVYGQKEVIDADRDQIPGKQRDQINKKKQVKQSDSNVLLMFYLLRYISM